MTALGVHAQLKQERRLLYGEWDMIYSSRIGVLEICKTYLVLESKGKTEKQSTPAAVVVIERSRCWDIRTGCTKIKTTYS